MEDLSFKKIRRVAYLTVFGSAFLFGCQSTQPDNIEPSCRNEVSDNCDADEDTGDDRGYNPCLVNKNLPVCKK